MDHIKGKVIDTVNNTLEDKICVTFQNHSPEAYRSLDPQFNMKNRRTGTDVMKVFWTVTRIVLRITDDVEYGQCDDKSLSPN